MKVAIVGSGLNRAYHVMMIGMGHDTVPVRSVEDIRPALKGGIDVVLFVGGADVNPKMYGHTVHQTTAYCDSEDELYEQAFCCAYEYDVKFVGICRGSQFLCVKAGGELIQHCDNHSFFGGHSVDTLYGEEFHVTSTHHQMQHPKEVNHTLIAWADYTTKKLQHRHGDTIDVKDYFKKDIEVVYYPHIRALAFQPHPEFDGAASTLELFKKCFKDYIEDKD